MARQVIAGDKPRMVRPDGGGSRTPCEDILLYFVGRRGSPKVFVTRVTHLTHF